MRMLLNLLIVAPGDPIETRHATRALVERSGPCYLRLGKAGEPVVHKARSTSNWARPSVEQNERVSRTRVIRLMQSEQLKAGAEAVQMHDDERP
jgi:hypothetical protein